MLIEPNSGNGAATPLVDALVERAGRFERGARATRLDEPGVALPTPALVHDYLLVLRGAERTFASMVEAFPDAPLYTLLYDRALDERFGGRAITTSPLQRLRPKQGSFRRLLPLFPRAAERLPTRGHDLVVSSSSAFAHRVRPAEGGVHVCYCHSPFRYVWHERKRAEREVPRLAAPFIDRVLDGIRSSDAKAARGVTRLVANSRITQRRIAEFWGLESAVVHPPVEVDRFRPGQPEDWFLVVGELVAHKRAEAALAAAKRAGVCLKVVGTGPEHKRLEALYGDTSDFLGRVDDQELASLYARARAVVLPNVEEFGIAAVEAQAAGRPIVALNAGGARETVVDGITGVLVDDDDGLAEALREVDFDRFRPSHATLNASRFAPEFFQERLRREVEQAWRAR